MKKKAAQGLAFVPADLLAPRARSPPAAKPCQEIPSLLAPGCASTRLEKALLVPLQSRRCSQGVKSTGISTEAGRGGRILPPHTVPVKDAPVCHTVDRRRWRPARHLSPSALLKSIFFQFFEGFNRSL